MLTFILTLVQIFKYILLNFQYLVEAIKNSNFLKSTKSFLFILYTFQFFRFIIFQK